MAMFFVWARRLDLFPGLDHTWVTTYDPVPSCPPDPEYWYCWGDCHTTVEGSESRLLDQGQGDLAGACKQSEPNEADDHAGITGFYGEHGVCHQVANRVLAAGKTGLNVDEARGTALSYLLYGKYGSDGTFPPKAKAMDESDSRLEAVSNLLGTALAKEFSPQALQTLHAIQRRLVAEKDRLAAKVNAGEITVTEFAIELNRLIAAAAPELRGVIGDARADHWLALPEPALLDVEIARSEDRKRGRETI